MKRLKFWSIWLLVALMIPLVTSCMQDVSGTYKAINPGKGFEKEEMYIKGNLAERRAYGKTTEHYKQSRETIVCDFTYIAVLECHLSVSDGKYKAEVKDYYIRINPDEFEAHVMFGGKPKISNDSLISYYENYFRQLVTNLFEEGKAEDKIPNFQFVVNGNKLIFVGGNEENDYYIKLVE